ncbi:MAG: HD-GYP domain-containing protein [Deltaproteobacteria bacterium]
MSQSSSLEQKIEIFSIHNVTPGMTVSQDIKDKNGFLLVKSGMQLNEKLIGKLLQFGIVEIPIFVTHQESNIPINNIYLNQIFREQLLSSINTSIISFIRNNEYCNRIINLARDLTKDDILMSLLVELKTMGYNVLIHSINVFALSMIIGFKKGFSTDRLIVLAQAAALHDIGKKFLPIEVLQHEENLSDEEKKTFEQHPLFSYEYLQSINGLNFEVPKICYQHHERMDGMGYPNKLSKDNTHKLAQIISLADSFACIIGNNIIKNRRGFSEAIEYLEGAGGVYFDLEDSKCLLEEISVYKINDWVTLSNDDIGIVTKNYDLAPLRPVVTVFFDKFKQKYSFPKQIDLASKNYANIFIKGVL